jgi:hypothetical protein
VALWVNPNIEFFGLDDVLPGNLNERVPREHAKVPNVRNWAVRDYGNRVGIWRIMEVLTRYGIRASAALNSEVCDHSPGDHRRGRPARLGAGRPQPDQRAAADRNGIRTIGPAVRNGRFDTRYRFRSKGSDQPRSLRRNQHFECCLLRRNVDARRGRDCIGTQPGGGATLQSGCPDMAKHHHHKPGSAGAQCVNWRWPSFKPVMPARFSTVACTRTSFHRWVERAGLDSSANGTHSSRRTKAAQIYKKTGNLRAGWMISGGKRWRRRLSKVMTTPYPIRQPLQTRFP